MITQAKLESLGLQASEAAVYLALLELGEGNVAQISQKAQLNRTTIYPVLDRLSIHGLVTRAEGKKTIFLPEPPSRLKQFLQNRARAAERRLKEAEEFLPELEKMYKTELKPIVRVAHGKEEMEKIYGHVLESKEEVFSILNLSGYAEIFDKLGKQQSKERSRKGIEQHVIALDNKTARKWHKEAYGNKKSKTHYRWIETPEGKFPIGEVLTFDDKVIVMLSSPDENIAYEIKSQSFADFLKIIFNLAWKQLDKEE